jgi:hypothetical protein
VRAKSRSDGKEGARRNCPLPTVPTTAGRVTCAEKVTKVGTGFGKAKEVGGDEVKTSREKDEQKASEEASRMASTPMRTAAILSC